MLVIGNGFLGSYIVNEFKNNGISSTGTHFTKGGHNIDIRNINSINDYVAEIKPDLIINCAAVGQIDYLENHPEIAFSINSDGAKNVAMIAQKYKTRLIHISTDSIFDGKKGMYSEDDIPNPLNVYARSKVRAEESVKENSDNYVIIRTNFYGFDHRGNWFFNWVLNSLKQNKQITGFTDIFFNPLEVSNLSKMISEISMTDYDGIIHLTSNEIITKYEFILKVAEVYALNKDLIKKGSYEKDANVIAQRPQNTTLSNKKAISLLSTSIIPLTESLIKIKEKTANL